MHITRREWYMAKIDEFLTEPMIQEMEISLYWNEAKRVAKLYYPIVILRVKGRISKSDARRRVTIIKS